MDKGMFKEVLHDCPRVVPVFMVTEKTDKCTEGEVVYWSWTGVLMSHRGPVSVKSSKLNFVGYCPIINLSDHAWPDMSRVMEAITR